jgi:hypothetical protein
MREKGYKRIDEIIENCPTRRLEEQRIAMGLGPTPGLKELREHHDEVRRAEAEVATSQESYFDGDSAFDHSQPAVQPTEEGEEEEQVIDRSEDVEGTKEEDSDEDPKGDRR